MRSSLRQLEMLKCLQMKEVCVEPGIQALSAELQPVPRKERAGKRKVFLFDPPGWNLAGQGELSKDDEKHLQAQIENCLREQDAQQGDLAITTAMGPGIGILFVECCTRCGIPVHCYFPGTEEGYIDHFVKKPFLDASGKLPESNRRPYENWLGRFMEMRNHVLVDDYYQQSCLGTPRKKNGKREDEFERNTRWAAYYAQVEGSDIINVMLEFEQAGCPEIKFEPGKKQDASGPPVRKNQQRRQPGEGSDEAASP
jgi:hypothetical protein